MAQSKGERAERDKQALWELFPDAYDIVSATNEEDRAGVDYWVYETKERRRGWNGKQQGTHHPDRPRWRSPFDPEFHVELGTDAAQLDQRGWAIAPVPHGLVGYLFSWPYEEWPYVYAFNAQALHMLVHFGLPIWRAQSPYRLKEAPVRSRRSRTDATTWTVRCCFPRLTDIHIAMAHERAPTFLDPGCPYQPLFLPERHA